MPTSNYIPDHATLQAAIDAITIDRDETAKYAKDLRTTISDLHAKVDYLQKQLELTRIERNLLLSIVKGNR